MSETNRRLPVAGWYPDPSSRAHVRYWDGAQWTGEERLIQFSTKQWQQRPVGRGFGRLGSVIGIGLMLLLFTGAGQVALHAWGIGMIDDAVASGDIGQLDAYDNADQLATAAYVVLTLIVGVCWMVWQYRLARSLSPGLPQRTPPWHAWSWLIPIGNLWLPLQNVRDLWRLLVPARSGQILGLWWTALLFTGFISRILNRAVDTVDSVDTFKSVVGWEIVADVLGIVAGIFAIWLVRTLTRAGLSQPDVNPAATPAA